MPQPPPIVLITPEAKSAIETEAEQAGATGGLTGGILFGHPVDERHRLVVSSVRPRPEVQFGEKEFCLDQSRTSQQLKHARTLSSEADYCGVWYVHRVPNQELTDEEWVQTQRVLEDPDFHFKDLVCIVVCLYFGDLNIYASSFDLQQSARSQMLEPTQLKLTTDSPSATTQAQPEEQSTPQPPADWYKAPDAVERLKLEREHLAQKYHVEPTITDGKLIFRLMPKHKHKDLVFYITCQPGFPEEPPAAFLSLRGDQYPLLSPGLSEWSTEKWLVEAADDLIEWQVNILDQQVATAEEALDRGDYQEASDLLAKVLSIAPRKPNAVHLLARAPALLKLKPESSPSFTQTTLSSLPSSSSAPESAPDWYKQPEIARRLKNEQERLTQNYRVESSLAPNGKLLFRLTPRYKHQDMIFYIACETGFPDKAPQAFLALRGDQYPILSPSLNKWSPDQWLAELADDLVAWQIHLLDQQIATAEEAMERGNHQEASDLLAMVLLVDPRRPRVARLLGQAQAMC